MRLKTRVHFEAEAAQEERIVNGISIEVTKKASSSGC
jgi:hypothetical protein